MGVKVYGVAASPYVATVLLCLEEAGAAYELVAVDMAAREQKPQHHLARNPFGKIPAFEDEEAYDAVGLAFAEASDELGARRYATARKEMARVAALVQRCDGGLARAGARTPLPRYSADCQQMAIIGIAIADLLK